MNTYLWSFSHVNVATENTCCLQFGKFEYVSMTVVLKLDLLEVLNHAVATENKLHLLFKQFECV